MLSVGSVPLAPVTDAAKAETVYTPGVLPLKLRPAFVALRLGARLLPLDARPLIVPLAPVAADKPLKLMLSGDWPPPALVSVTVTPAEPPLMIVCAAMWPPGNSSAR